MKLSSITLATAALALAGSAAFADTTTVNRTVQVGPNGEVTHVVKRTENADGSTRTVHKVRHVTQVTTPVVVHRKVIYHGPGYWRHHHRNVAYVVPSHRHDRVVYRNHNDSYAVNRHHDELRHMDAPRLRRDNNG
jgi:hypothetical protein